jgi:glycerol-3-phosphate dehydrogenase (NAD(P)+)
MSKIVILGAGNMGTALAVVLGEKETNEVVLWSVEEDVVADINSNNTNSKYLEGVKLRSSIKASGDLKTSLTNADFAVFSVPSNIVRVVAEQAKGLIPEKAVIVDIGKGLEKNSDKRLSEVLNEFFPNPIVVIGGPSIANELGRKAPTFVVFASEKEDVLSSAKSVFETDYYKISLSTDVVGVELCGALKNIIAIMAGVVDGLGYSTNTKAGVISNGLEELGLIVEKMGGLKSTVYSLAGLGDLVVTCTSPHSRNRRFGELIAKGKSKDEARELIGQVVEGEKAVVIAKKIIDEFKLDTPLIEKVYKIIVLNEKPDV